ncbi:substrate-binding domain-containing protein [Streptomyces paromomycinus]|uniref:substrate-binding domain-containing protein n=1 Tax=Streptomyces paromomycinus TaxID=92743 RepID=UPI001FE8C9F8
MFVHSDSGAIDLLGRARDRGLTVPGDLAVLRRRGPDAGAVTAAPAGAAVAAATGRKVATAAAPAAELLAARSAPSPTASSSRPTAHRCSSWPAAVTGWT